MMANRKTTRGGKLLRMVTVRHQWVFGGFSGTICFTILTSWAREHICSPLWVMFHLRPYSAMPLEGIPRHIYLLVSSTVALTRSHIHLWQKQRNRAQRETSSVNLIASSNNVRLFVKQIVLINDYSVYPSPACHDWAYQCITASWHSTQNRIRNFSSMAVTGTDQFDILLKGERYKIKWHEEPNS